jgi:hypothetical protein
MKKPGVIILAFGLLITLFTGFKFFTREKVADIGELEITANKRHNVSWSPFLGIAVMAVGGVMFAYGSKKE